LVDGGNREIEGDAINFLATPLVKKMYSPDNEKPNLVTKLANLHNLIMGFVILLDSHVSEMVFKAALAHSGKDSFYLDGQMKKTGVYGFPLHDLHGSIFDNQLQVYRLSPICYL
jgi:hypothetical protein